LNLSAIGFSFFVAIVVLLGSRLVERGPWFPADYPSRAAAGRAGAPPVSHEAGKGATFSFTLEQPGKGPGKG
jgi:hypothetical protein